MSNNKQIHLSKASLKLRAQVRANSINNALLAADKYEDKELRNAKDNVKKFDKKKGFK